MTEDYRQRAAATKRTRTNHAIKQAAAMLFERHGWTGTTLEAVAKEAGVSVATLHNHYKTKQALAFAVYSPQLSELMLGVLRDLVAQPGQPLLAIERCVGRLAFYAHQDRALTETYASMIADVLGAGDQVEWLNLVVGPLSSVLTEAQNLGVIRLERSPDELAFHHANGLMLRVLRLPEEPAEETAAFILSQLLPAITASPGPRVPDAESQGHA